MINQEINNINFSLENIAFNSLKKRIADSSYVSIEENPNKAIKCYLMSSYREMEKLHNQSCCDYLQERYIDAVIAGQQIYGYYRLWKCANLGAYVFDPTTSIIPKLKKHKEELLLHLVKNERFNSIVTKKNYEKNLPLINENKLHNVKEAFLKSINFSLPMEGNDSIWELVPKYFLDIKVENDCIIAVTKIYSIRFRGGTYNLGPYEINIPLVHNLNETNHGKELFRSIGIKYHNFLKSKIIDKGYILISDDEELEHNIHPHISSESHSNRSGVDEYKRCCFGNYENPLNNYLSIKNYKMVLIHLHEYLGSVMMHDWYNNFKYFSYVDPKNYFKKGATEFPILYKPVSDHKFYENVEDFWCTGEDRPQPTVDKPHPWMVTSKISNKIGGDNYVTPYYEKDFVDGFDPEGYDSLGYNKKGLDREGGFQGYDSEGFDARGFNEEGYDREGYDRDGFNIYGYDRDGYNSSGYNSERLDREGYNPYGFNREGFNRDGYDQEGYDSDGYNSAGFNRAGLDRDGNTSPSLPTTDASPTAETSTGNTIRWEIDQNRFVVSSDYDRYRDTLHIPATYTINLEEND